MYKVYDGTHDVRKFVAKVELEASLKNHADEKKAQYIASKLVGHAMDVYLRMSTEDQKDPEKVKTELLKEFERGQLNREEAIAELDGRKRLPKESADDFVRLAGVGDMISTIRRAQISSPDYMVQKQFPSLIHKKPSPPNRNLKMQVLLRTKYRVTQRQLRL